MSERKRVMMVVPSLHRGGAERLVLSMADQLQQRGHELRIITLHPGNQFPELSLGLDIRTVEARVSYSLTGKDDLRLEGYLREWADFRPDIVHSHLFESELVSMAAHQPGTAHLTHWHGCHPPTDPIKPLDLLNRDTWWNLNNVRRLRNNYRLKGNHFLLISEFIRGYVARVFDPAEADMTVIQNPIDLAHFKLDRQPSTGFQLLNIGSMTSLKNQRFLIRVMSTLRALGHTDVHLTLLGDGPDRPQLERAVADQNLTQQITFAGIVGNPDQWLNRSQLLVHSAPLEPFGLVVLEAKACGVPAIGFNQGGITEVIRDGVDGFLVPFNNVDAYAQRIVQLKADPQLWNRMSAAGIDSVGQFAMPIYMDRLEGLYHRLLSPES